VYSVDVTCIFLEGFTLRSVQSPTAILAVATSLTALANPSCAFTTEAQSQCTGDAFRLCNSEIPDIDRIAACMLKKRSRLNSGCRIEVDEGSLQNLTGEPRSNRRIRRMPSVVDHPLARL
jgi:hypothetical protein